MEQVDFVIAANRLPVDGDPDSGWSTSPGGLVAALEPVMQETDGAWVGWCGKADLELEPFEIDGMQLVPVHLTEQELEDYYEGFSNDTLWPLYHDVISPPAFHRQWWDAYVRVNRRFAEACSEVAKLNGTVWVHDYQLQLVPQMLREIRPDLTIGYFHHIPFPAFGLFAQLPWRRQVLEGLLGADVIGFQRPADASNFIRSVKRALRFETRSSVITVPNFNGGSRYVVARAFPISIDAQGYAQLALEPKIMARAAEIRAELGQSGKILLGVDRLDYTKGIRHRLKAFQELLEDGAIDVGEVTLVQIASPSRERVEAYMQLRDEVELTVGRINGTYDTVEHTAVRYLHQGHPREEMVALYMAADVMLVTALRDGMNLVAKEYVASRNDNLGVLVLSEFTGAADELTSALMVNPHDIDGTKAQILRAIEMPLTEQRRRMRSMRRKVFANDVTAWSNSFMGALAQARSARLTGETQV